MEAPLVMIWPRATRLWMSLALKLKVHLRRMRPTRVATGRCAVSTLAFVSAVSPRDSLTPTLATLV